MREVSLAIATVATSLVVAGCGGDEDKPSRTIPFEPPAETGVSTAVRDYLRALNSGDGKRACRLLDDRGKASLIAFLPSSSASITCERAVRRVRRQIVPLREFTIKEVSASGRSATANVEATEPKYASAVLLSNLGDGWKISYPPGLLTRSGRPPPGAVPGVPLERD